MIDAHKSANAPKKFIRTTHSNQANNIESLSIQKTNSNHLSELEENTNKVSVKKIKISSVSSRKGSKPGNIFADNNSSQRSIEVQEFNDTLQQVCILDLKSRQSTVTSVTYPSKSMNSCNNPPFKVNKDDG